MYEVRKLRGILSHLPDDCEVVVDTGSVLHGDGFAVNQINVEYSNGSVTPIVRLKIKLEYESDRIKEADQDNEDSK